MPRSLKDKQPERQLEDKQLVGDTCYFMDKGQITYKTKIDELKKDSGVLKKYLGVSF